MATTTQVKTDMDTVITHLGDGSLTPALINANSPAGLSTTCMSLLEKLQRMLKDSGRSAVHQPSIDKL